MRKTHATVGLFLLLSACGATNESLRIPEALAAEKIEVALDENGQMIEVEYHVPTAAVPRAVRDAMQGLYPGEVDPLGEKEFVDGTLVWELTAVVDGVAVAVMFLPDGTLYAEEIQTASPHVPEAVRASVEADEWGSVTSWEVVRDGDREPVAYHAETAKDGKAYKLVIGLEGKLRSVYREINAEIEVPVR